MVMTSCWRDICWSIILIMHVFRTFREHMDHFQKTLRHAAWHEKLSTFSISHLPQGALSWMIKGGPGEHFKGQARNKLLEICRKVGHANAGETLLGAISLAIQWRNEDHSPPLIVQCHCYPWEGHSFPQEIWYSTHFLPHAIFSFYFWGA